MHKLNYYSFYFFLVIFLNFFTPTYAAIIEPNDAVITGFSGKLDQPTNDYQFFNLLGPSLKVISLVTSGDFGLRETVEKYVAHANEIGQVFSVVLDNKNPPNIYAAATSIYGLVIFTEEDGRLQQGAPNALFAPGQFGSLHMGGGPNSIWRIDGKTGKISLFATVSFNHIKNNPASLGGLAFDARTQQIFVADRGTGMIHRYSLDGKEKGIFDHGVTGRKAVGLPIKAFDPATIADITKPSFDVQSIDTWGFAPDERCVFALKIHQNRLYYSVAGREIWSVGINKDGSFGVDVKREIKLLPLKPKTEITSIAFDTQGYLYLAERGSITGSYPFVAVAESPKNRVLRYAPDLVNGTWKEIPEEYAIGMAGAYQNANGGMALWCDKTLWATGDRLLATTNNSLVIDGLQGVFINSIKPKNAPPVQSWFIDYYHHESDAAVRGYIGAITIFEKCGSNKSIQY